MKKYCGYAGAGLVLALSTQAMAVITDANGLRIQLRRFNDYGASTLVVTPAPPLSPLTPQFYPVAGKPDVVFNEGPFGAGGFTNHHNVRFSTDAGATDYKLVGPAPGPGVHSTDAFDLSFNIRLAVGDVVTTKEAGFRQDTFIAGESFFIVKSNGEVAAFGGPLPFFSFGGAGSGAYLAAAAVGPRGASLVVPLAEQRLERTQGQGLRP